jgi:hypothetical protein
MILVPLSDDTIIYARPDGGHYHMNKDCPTLRGDFDKLGYVQTTLTKVKERHLIPCVCTYLNFKPHP